MNVVKNVRAEFLFPVIKELIEEGQIVSFSVTGTSMVPFLREHIDSVEVNKVDFADIIRGDIVVTARIDGSYVMHRILKKNKASYYLIGDAQRWPEGPHKAHEVIGRVKAVWRSGRYIECSNFWWRTFSSLWLILRPFRYSIFRGYGKVKRISKVLNFGIEKKEIHNM